MFLDNLPDWIRIALLFAAGAVLGALINLAIYQLAYNKRRISPWSPAPKDQKRNWLDRIPIAGWWFLKRESETFGRFHWIRPMAIELASAVGLVFLYGWYDAGGLFALDINRIEPKQVPMLDNWNSTWFLFHLVLFVLITIATFIDFDEQTIPDWITVPGTIFALVIAAIAPNARLPIHGQGGIGGIPLESLTFWTPDPAVDWHTTSTGLLVGAGILLLWGFALIPKFLTLRFGLKRGWQLMWFSMVPRKRTAPCSLDRTPRRIRLDTVLFVVATIVLLGWMFFVKAQWGGDHWESLFGSLAGLAIGGGIVWAVRIIGGYALQTEAMGFGDVTLMCMVGAFLGWQPALLIFVFAPFASILIALVQLVLKKENKLAFGPYLCISTAFLIFGWFYIWNDWAVRGPFVLGNRFLLMIIGVCLVLMLVMLSVWSWIKNARYGDED